MPRWTSRWNGVGEFVDAAFRSEFVEGTAEGGEGCCFGDDEASELHRLRLEYGVELSSGVILEVGGEVVGFAEPVGFIVDLVTDGRQHGHDDLGNKSLFVAEVHVDGLFGHAGKGASSSAM